jgi:hypothetical protein
MVSDRNYTVRSYPPEDQLFDLLWVLHTPLWVQELLPFVKRRSPGYVWFRAKLHPLVPTKIKLSPLISPSACYSQRLDDVAIRMLQPTPGRRRHPYVTANAWTTSPSACYSQRLDDVAIRMLQPTPGRYKVRSSSPSTPQMSGLVMSLHLQPHPPHLHR